MSKTKEVPIPGGPKIYNRFDRPKIEGIKCPTPGLTQQQFKDECDINYIVANYTKTGEWSKSGLSPSTMPMFGDFTEAPDFLEAQNLIVESSQLFAQLPSGIRKRFDNDPYKFLEFVGDPKNTDEAITLGIATKKPTPEEAKTGNPVSAQ